MLQNKKKDYHYANINVVSKYSENTARIDRCREHVSMLQTASRTTAMSNDKTRKKQQHLLQKKCHMWTAQQSGLLKEEIMVRTGKHINR